MIHVSVIRDKDGFIWQFGIKGHAGYSEYGRDIVCAAVSAVAYTALGALEEFAGIRNYTERNGLMECSIPADIPENKKLIVRIILETMVIGLKQIEFKYKDYMTILDEEV